MADLRTKALAAKTAEQARWAQAATNTTLALAVLRECLQEALESWKDAAHYKGEFLAEKHGDHERIAEMAALLETLASKPAWFVARYRIGNGGRQFVGIVGDTTEAYGKTLSEFGLTFGFEPARVGRYAALNLTRFDKREDADAAVAAVGLSRGDLMDEPICSTRLTWRAEWHTHFDSSDTRHLYEGPDYEAARAACCAIPLADVYEYGFIKCVAVDGVKTKSADSGLAS